MEGTILDKFSLDKILKEDKKDFLNEIYYTTITRSKLLVYLLIVLYFILIVSEYFNLGKQNEVFTLSFYSHIVSIILWSLFIVLISINKPDNKEDINLYHIVVIHTVIFLSLFTLTITAIGDNIIAKSISIYIGAIFIFSILTITKNFFSSFLYLFNMILILYYVNISSLFKLTPEIIFDQNISIVLFTFIAWIFSRYLFYEKIKNYIQEKEREELILKLKNALNDVNTLNGMLPICSSCKNIRDDQGYWNKIEHYVAKHSDAEFTHSMCPSCVKELYPDVYEEEFESHDFNNLIKGD